MQACQGYIRLQYAKHVMKDDVGINSRFRYAMKRFANHCVSEFASTWQVKWHSVHDRTESQPTSVYHGEQLCAYKIMEWYRVIELILMKIGTSWL